jgi:hypothetical protein
MWILMAENNKKKKQGRLSFLCAASLLSKIYPPMKFQVDTSEKNWIEKLSMKNNKGQ